MEISEELKKELEDYMSPKIKILMTEEFSFNKFIETNRSSLNDYVRGSFEFWFKTLTQAEKTALNTIISIVYMNGQNSMAKFMPEFISDLIDAAMNHQEKENQKNENGNERERDGDSKQEDRAT